MRELIGARRADEAATDDDDVGQGAHAARTVVRLARACFRAYFLGREGGGELDIVGDASHAVAVTHDARHFEAAGPGTDEVIADLHSRATPEVEPRCTRHALHRHLTPLSLSNTIARGPACGRWRVPVSMHQTPAHIY